ncbi:MAG: hypothetical protein NPIRA01_05120 [Nitrospirales bacterium]|nr:MAG: hypothetical protein NPIRA01_05120 [Nitrospirales bacterium]
MKSLSQRKHGLLGGLCVFSVCVAFNVSAETNTMVKVTPDSSNGLIATVDPDTGRLVSGEMAAKIMERQSLKVDVQKFRSSLQAMMAADRDVSELAEKKMATGAVKVDLKGHFRSPVLATVHPDQTIVLTHEMGVTHIDHNSTEK